MRSFMVAMAAIVAGCAGQPTTPAPTAHTTYTSNAPVVATATNPDGTPVSVDKAVVDAKKLGYTVVNENGETMYCHKVAKTGSHLAMETTCLTAKQMEDLREQTQRNMQNFQMQMPPPQGK